MPICKHPIRDTLERSHFHIGRGTPSSLRSRIFFTEVKLSKPVILAFLQGRDILTPFSSFKTRLNSVARALAFAASPSFEIVDTKVLESYLAPGLGCDLGIFGRHVRETATVGRRFVLNLPLPRCLPCHPWGVLERTDELERKRKEVRKKKNVLEDKKIRKRRSKESIFKI